MINIGEELVEISTFKKHHHIQIQIILKFVMILIMVSGETGCEINAKI